VFGGDGTGGPELAAVAVSRSTGFFTGPFYAPFALDPPIDVADGATYTWFLDMAAGELEVLYAETDVAAGTAYAGPSAASAGPIADDDMAFRAVFGAPDMWLASTSDAGSVLPGAASARDVTFDATGLAGGTYTAALVLTTNDPAAPSVTVPVALTVAGVDAEDGPEAPGPWLAAPAPNPTRGTATLAYRLAEPGVARLSVVDLLGREVVVLAEGPHAAGEARASVPAGLAPGVYVVRLVAGDAVRTQRAVVAW